MMCQLGDQPKWLRDAHSRPTEVPKGMHTCILSFVRLQGNTYFNAFRVVYHPQSNRQAERFVDTLKQAMFRAKDEGTSDEILDRFILVHRATFHPTFEGK